MLGWHKTEKKQRCGNMRYVSIVANGAQIRVQGQRGKSCGRNGRAGWNQAVNSGEGHWEFMQQVLTTQSGVWGPAGSLPPGSLLDMQHPRTAKLDPASSQLNTSLQFAPWSLRSTLRGDRLPCVELGAEKEVGRYIVQVPVFISFNPHNELLWPSLY